MKLYLTSELKCLSEIESFKNLINRETKLVILPFSYHEDYISCCEDIWRRFNRSPFATNSIFWSTVKPFVDSGIDPDNITIINQYSDNIAYIKYKITRDNTIVYLPGGYPENIVKNMLKCDLANEIKKCQVIVGESAGSMAIFKEFFVYKDQDYSGYKSFKGLNIVNRMTVIPHAKITDPNIMEACTIFKRVRRRTNLYCIMDGGYITIENGAIVEAHKTYTFALKKKTVDTKIPSILFVNI